MQVKMIKDWDIDLLGLTAQHKSGIKIKKLVGEYPDHSHWETIVGNCDEPLLNDGIKCYEHEWAKHALKAYQEKDKLSLCEIADLTNTYSYEKGYNLEISESLLEDYLIDKELFPINIISTIRSALYFYRRQPKA